MIDISTPIDDRLPNWPGMPRVAYTQLKSIGAGDDANVRQITADLHTGTHVDAPLHFVAGGATLEQVGLDPFVGPAFVADAGEALRLGHAELDALDVPSDVTRLLLRTANTRARQLRQPEFAQDAVALTPEGSEWCVARGLKLIGIDYLSIQSIHDGPETHQILLRNDVMILEGLALESAEPGRYDLLCLPLRLVGTEAAPARAVLLPEGTTT